MSAFTRGKAVAVPADDDDDEACGKAPSSPHLPSPPAGAITGSVDLIDAGVELITQYNKLASAPVTAETEAEEEGLDVSNNPLLTPAWNRDLGIINNMWYLLCQFT